MNATICTSVRDPFLFCAPALGRDKRLNATFFSNENAKHWLRSAA